MEIWITVLLFLLGLLLIITSLRLPLGGKAAVPEVRLPRSAGGRGGGQRFPALGPGVLHRLAQELDAQTAT